MTWLQQLGKLPAKSIEPWESNDRVWQEFLAHLKSYNRKNTRRNLATNVGVFIRTFEPLVTTLDRVDVEAFVNKMERKCSRLILDSPPQCRRKYPIDVCPILIGAETSGCNGYRPLQPSGVWAYICAINRFYEWLLTEGRINKNPALPVMRAYMEKYREWFDERRRKPDRRPFLPEEIRRLVKGSPIHHAIAYLLMAKCFLRIHEVLKLTVDEAHFNLEEGWMDIPIDTEYGGKRKGNRRIILDAELKRWMRAYLTWRDEKIRRTSRGQLPTTRLLVTVFGRPWGSGAVQNFNKTLQADAIDCKIMTGDETERDQRVNSHAFRAFSTTWALDHDCPPRQLQVLRGDLAIGALERYDEYLRRLPELYRKYGPVIGL